MPVLLFPVADRCPACRSVAALLFPIFASYKALQANDQTQLTPWLMYWVVIACVILIDNFFGWFLSVYHPQSPRPPGDKSEPLVNHRSLPLYQEIKAVFLLWLVLPQTKVCPFIAVQEVQ